MHVSLTKWCDCSTSSTSYLELNLAIALVIAESRYASSVIVALLLERVIIIMELNMATASLYYPYHRAVVFSCGCCSLRT